DLGLQVLHGHIRLGAVGGSLSLGVSVFFIVLAGAALMRARAGPAARWAAANPWRFAFLPGGSGAVLAFLLTILLRRGGLRPGLRGGQGAGRGGSPSCRGCRSRFSPSCSPCCGAAGS